MKLYVITIILILASIFLVIPNLSTNLADYKKNDAILLRTSVKIDTLKEHMFRNEIERTLILEMENHKKWFINNKKYLEYWPKIQDSNNIGKKFTFYSANNKTKRHNPFRIEIENEVVYDFSKDKLLEYSILLITLCTMYFSIRKYQKEKTKDDF